MTSIRAKKRVTAKLQKKVNCILNLSGNVINIILVSCTSSAVVNSYVLGCSFDFFLFQRFKILVVILFMLFLILSS